MIKEERFSAQSQAAAEHYHDTIYIHPILYINSLFWVWGGGGRLRASLEFGYDRCLCGSVVLLSCVHLIDSLKYRRPVGEGWDV